MEGHHILLVSILWCLPWFYVHAQGDNDRNSSSPSSLPLTPSVVTPDAAETLLRECEKDEFRFAYTECDHNDNRWLVAIPSKDDCGSLKEPRIPKRGLKCSFSCQPGEYLSLATQSCVKCPAGHYSVGDGKRFADWSALPEGFSTKGQDPDQSPYNMEVPSNAPPVQYPCEKSTWQPRGQYLESAGSSCKSLLSYEVDLKKPGNVSFTVSSNDERGFLHVWVVSLKHCSSYGDGGKPDLESQGMEGYYSSLNSSWITYQLVMPKGRSIVNFVATYFPQNMEEDASKYDTNADHTVMIKEIVVRGFNYAETCEPCEPGTFSPPGSASCQTCPEDNYSKGSSGNCFACKPDEWSSAGSSECFPKKPCAENDYHMYWDRCVLGKTKKSFTWNLPKRCSETMATSVSLPPPGSEIDCPSCNPGQFHNESYGCSFCPSGTFNMIGKGECTKCPPGSEEAPGLFYNFWTQVPGSPMHLFCQANSVSGCRSKLGWEVHDLYLSSGIGHADDARIVLYLVIPGFTKDFSLLTLEFEVDCETDKCRLLLQNVENGNVHTIGSWIGRTERKVFKYERHSRYPTRYRIVFEKEYDDAKQTFFLAASRVQIYSLEVTNVVGGGTRMCSPCVINEDSGCISCRPGEYMDLDSKQCVPCPRGTFMPDSKLAVLGVRACSPCPRGTTSEKGAVVCHSDCHFTGKTGNHYDFSALAGFHLVRGSKLFTTKGYPYYHLFNVSLCGPNAMPVQCRDNASSAVEEGASERPTLHSAVCRSTIIPDNNNILSAQSISIGEHLWELRELTEQLNRNDTKKEMILASSSSKVVFTFNSKRVTERCENGTRAVLELICDPEAIGKGRIQLGNSACDTETCDGCSYLMTWFTQLACPVCTTSDYINITTGCENGRKKIHYLWKQPHVCFEKDVSKPDDVDKECTIFEKNILDFKLAILVFFVGAIFLALIVLFLIYRNRKLTYKYSRLIDASHSKDGELPPVDQCGQEEGQDDEDEEFVAVKGKNNSRRIMDRLKGITGNKKRENFTEFESINLDSLKTHSDDDDDEL